MKWCRTIFLFVLFVAATQLLPAIHAADCADDHDRQHAPDSCPVCQVFHAPLEAPPAFVAPVAVETAPALAAFFPPSPVCCFFPRTATQPRAPPVSNCSDK